MWCGAERTFIRTSAGGALTRREKLCHETEKEDYSKRGGAGDTLLGAVELRQEECPTQCAATSNTERIETILETGAVINGKIVLWR